MDKETLSNYGWIVICILVLSVMIALATPFGRYIATAVENTTEALFKTQQSALSAADIEIMGQEFEDMFNGGGSGGGYDHNAPELHPIQTIPEGATYAKADGTLLIAGDAFPETTQTGDIYTYGNYTYGYNKHIGSVNIAWYTDETQNGWGVRCINDVAEPGPILESINGEPVTNMTNTFTNHYTLTTAPVVPNSVTCMEKTFCGEHSLKTYAGSTDSDGDFSGYKIPNSVTNMCATFLGCENLTIAPVIPSSVTNMSNTFALCTSLTTAPRLPSSVTDMTFAFHYCTSLKTYAGSTNSDGDLGGYIIPTGVTNMEGVFSECTSLTIAPKIPNGVTNIDSTFYGCTSLTAVPRLPSSVTDMSSTFAYCTSLTDLSDFIIPSSVTNMEGSFEMCTSLTIAPNMSNATGLSNMDFAFCYCTSLIVPPVIPNSVTNMEFAFEGCTALTEVLEIPITCQSQYIGYDNVIYK